MDLKKRYRQILSEAEQLMNEYEREAEYALARWDELKNIASTLWTEAGGQGKPDARKIDQIAGAGFLHNFIGDADTALESCCKWEERKRFNEDILNVFELDCGLDGNCHYAIAESIKETQGLDAALAYVDAWSGEIENPASAWPDAVRISLYFFAGEIQEAREIADRYISLPYGSFEDDSILFDMCENVYAELDDQDMMARLNMHRKLLQDAGAVPLEDLYISTVREFLGKDVREDIPPGMKTLFDEAVPVFGDEEEVLDILYEGTSRFFRPAEFETESSTLDALVLNGARDALEREKRIRAAMARGRFETLEDLISALDPETRETVLQAMDIQQDDPAQLAKRLMTQGAFRNMFISMHDDTLAVLRRCIGDPQTVLNPDEQVLLYTEIPLCFYVTKEDTVLLAQDFIDQFEKLDTPAFHAQRKQNSWVLDCLYTVYTCYGVLKDTELLKLIAQNGTKLTGKEVKKIYMGLPAGRKIVSFEGGYVFNDLFGKQKQYAARRAEWRKKLPFKARSEAEISGLYAYGYPHAVEAYRKMREYLLSLCGNNASAFDRVHSLFLNMQYSDFGDMIRTVNKDIPEENIDPRKTADTIMDIARNTPRFNLSGHTPAEADSLLR